MDEKRQTDDLLTADLRDRYRRDTNEFIDSLKKAPGAEDGRCKTICETDGGRCVLPDGHEGYHSHGTKNPAPESEGNFRKSEGNPAPDPVRTEGGGLCLGGEACVCTPGWGHKAWTPSNPPPARKGTKAFVGFGTQTYLEGVKIGEVRRIEIRNGRVVVTANFLPADAGQELGRHSTIGDLRLVYPDGSEHLFAKMQVASVSMIKPDEVATSVFIFSPSGATDLACCECGAVLEQGKEEWLARAGQGDLGPLCANCYEDLEAGKKNSNASDVRDAATGER